MAKPVVVQSVQGPTRASSVLDSWTKDRWAEWDVAFKEAQRQYDLGLIDYKAAQDAVVAAQAAFDAEAKARLDRVAELEDAIRELNLQEHRKQQARQLAQDQELNELAEAAVDRDIRVSAANQGATNAARQFSAGESNESQRRALGLSVGGGGGGGQRAADDPNLPKLIRETQGMEGLAGVGLELGDVLALQDATAFTDSLAATLYTAPRAGTGATVMDPTERRKVVAGALERWAADGILAGRFKAEGDLTPMDVAMRHIKATPVGQALIDEANLSVDEQAASGGGGGGVRVVTPQGGEGYAPALIGAPVSGAQGLRDYEKFSDAELRAQLDAARQAAEAGPDRGSLEAAAAAARALRPDGDLVQTSRALHAKYFGSPRSAARWAPYANPSKMVEAARSMTAQRRSDAGGFVAPTPGGTAPALDDAAKRVLDSGAVGRDGRVVQDAVFAGDAATKRVVDQIEGMGAPGKRVSVKAASDALTRSGLPDDQVKAALDYIVQSRMIRAQGGRALPEAPK